MYIYRITKQNQISNNVCSRFYVLDVLEIVRFKILESIIAKTLCCKNILKSLFFIYIK